MSSLLKIFIAALIIPYLIVLLSTPLYWFVYLELPDLNVMNWSKNGRSLLLFASFLLCILIILIKERQL